MAFADTNLYIDGALRPARDGRVYENIAPATEAVIGRAADADTADAEDAIAAARRAFDNSDWSTNLALRLDALTRLHEELTRAAEVNRARVSAETGAPIGLTRSYQYDLPVEFIPWVVEHARSFAFERDLGEYVSMGSPTRRMVVKEAAGVVAAITPWNAPVQINLAKIVSALAAGCTVVLKAAPETPWSAALIGEAAAAAGFPAGVLNVLTSSHKAAIGESLVRDPRVDVVSFTGSTETGRRIAASAAESIKKVFLELGGKSANIILDDAEFPTALYGSLGVCFHAGQGCSIATRMLLPRSRYEEAIGILKGILESVSYGDPNNAEQFMGPVVSAAQRDRVMEYIGIGRAEGARLVTGGRVPDLPAQGYYIQPTLFADVTNEMRIAREEIFGPVLVAIPYEDDDDAVRIANDSIYGLGGAVSGSPARAMNIARRIRTGTMNVNFGNVFGPDSPFGGYKQSGNGREMGAEGFEEFLETKVIGTPA
ncbi:aldehyde dehydrogenase family protein [Sphingosinicella soli]|uniref:Aldehyde dehydrogenase (NAD+) n=1 Tax=Sphingosinicella soli TaxID=333708 RepID=A0A7W7F6M3_9SPHN|nr:aldehyde dehydrogenase family protein [Sphingosinicella soli]MBB4632675.1 aldehyde dehydrogenase (NAD+) [Sphingosinicella soli]